MPPFSETLTLCFSTPYMDHYIGNTTSFVTLVSTSILIKFHKVHLHSIFIPNCNMVPTSAMPPCRKSVNNYIPLRGNKKYTSNRLKRTNKTQKEKKEKLTFLLTVIFQFNVLLISANYFHVMLMHVRYAFL